MADATEPRCACGLACIQVGLVESTYNSTFSPELGFVVVGGDDLWTSPDGQSWSREAAPPPVEQDGPMAASAGTVLVDDAHIGNTGLWLWVPR